MPSMAARRSASIVSWGNWASASAISSARSRWAPSATISVSSPIASASSASTMRPVRIMSSARPSPTIRGSRWVPPSISGTPKRRSVKPSFDPSAAIRRSHHSASSSPPARHQPPMAAIVGFVGVSRVKPSGPSARSRRDTNVSIAFRSAPGAERHAARAGEDHHARVVVGLEPLVGVGQLGGRGPVDRVAALLAVDRHDRRGAAALVGHRHAATLPSG